MRCTSLNVLALASVSLIASAPGAPQFSPGCTLPFDATKVEREVDLKCGIEGQFSHERYRVQNLAKNNFCAQGPPALATFVTFDRLHTAAKEAGFSYGGPSSPRVDRSGYEEFGHTTSEGAVLGEGSLVRIAAYIVHADYSNENSGGENVNCNRSGGEWNDIHINLASNRNEDDFCKTVVVEMSPHYRPRAWEEVTHVTIRRPVRVTGALFFDASHKPCEGGQRSTTPRRSTWEIHPIYNIEVCHKTALTQCKAYRDSDWMPIELWVGIE